MSGFEEFNDKENELIDEHADILKVFVGTALSKSECKNIFAGFLSDMKEANEFYTRQEKALHKHFVSKRSELLIGLLTMLEKDGGNEFIDKAEIVAKYEANL